jgi:hypothetical protein
MRALAFGAFGALGVLACAPPVRTLVAVARDTSFREAPPELVPLPSLKQDPSPVEIRRDPASRRHSAPSASREVLYRFELERSGTREALRAVVYEPDRPALVVGDRGTALVRLPEAGWTSEVTGTTANLLAVARIRAFGQSASSDESLATHLAVGSRGVAVVRSPEGSWHEEATGTTADLHAIWGGMLAVGANGAMVMRSPEGKWRTIPTRTNATLHGIGLCDGRVCALGENGTVVECAFPANEEPVCIPRRPPTTATLRAVLGEVLLVGDGAWLSIAPSSANDPRSPPEWQPWRFASQLDESARVQAVAKNDWVESETLMVGRAGGAWLLRNWIASDRPIEKLALPYQVDFHGVAYARADGVLVGDGGTIVKLGVHGHALPTTTLD